MVFVASLRFQLGVCFAASVSLLTGINGYTPSYKYLHDVCNPAQPVTFTKDALVEWDRYNSFLTQGSCQGVYQSLAGRWNQVQVRFRYLDIPMWGNLNCSVVGLALKDGNRNLTPPGGVCGFQRPSDVYRSNSNKVLVQMTNKGPSVAGDFELLLTAFYWPTNRTGTYQERCCDDTPTCCHTRHRPTQLHYTDTARANQYHHKDGSCQSDDFKCNNGICISRDVTCNGFDDCGDNSDEVEGCSLAAGIIAGIVVSAIVFVFFLVAVGFCVRRRRMTYIRVTEEAQDLILDTLQTLAARTDMLEIEHELMKNRFSALQRRADWQENHMRRLNLLFYGLPKSGPETPEQCRAAVTRVLREAMGVAGEVRVEHARRLSRGGAVVVRFLSLADKLLVLSRSRSLQQGSALRVSEDFSQRVREVRKGLRRLQNTYRNEGKRAVMSFDKLYTDFDVFTFDLNTRTAVKVYRQPQAQSQLQPQPSTSSAHSQYLAMNLQMLRAQQQYSQREGDRLSVGSGGSFSE